MHVANMASADWWREELCQRAREFGKAPALVCGADGEKVTYAELPDVLRERGRDLQRQLQSEWQVASGVGLRFSNLYLRRMDTPWEAALDVLAVGWMGAAVLPLSARWPEKRWREFLLSFGLESANALFQRDGAAVWGRGASALGPGTLLATSGSTGEPKLVHHTWAAHWANAAGAATVLPLGPGRAWGVNLPLWHASGWCAVLRCLHGGAAAVLFSGNEPLHPKCPHLTHLSMVATQLKRHLGAGTPPPASCQAVLVGGGPVPGALRAEASAAGWPLHVTYGMTETASQICTTARWPSSWQKGLQKEMAEVSGPALPGRAVRARGDGELEVRGEMLLTGYWHPQRGWEVPMDSEGWFATGDLGEWIAGDGNGGDENGGGWKINGRRDRRFVCAGENISPERIEGVLLGLPGIHRVAVVPQEDAEYGQRPVAFVEGVGKVEVWREQAREVLTGLEMPASWFPWPEEARGAEKPPLQFFRQLLARAQGKGY